MTDLKKRGAFVGCAALVYCGISFLIPHAKIIKRAAATLGFAYAIELSQLYHAPWIDAVRETTLGGLVLGFHFVWIDLIRYAVGTMFCVVVESGITPRPGQVIVDPGKTTDEHR